MEHRAWSTLPSRSIELGAAAAGSSWERAPYSEHRAVSWVHAVGACSQLTARCCELGARCGSLLPAQSFELSARNMELGARRELGSWEHLVSPRRSRRCWRTGHRLAPHVAEALGLSTRPSLKNISGFRGKENAKS